MGGTGRFAPPERSAFVILTYSILTSLEPVLLVGV